MVKIFPLKSRFFIQVQISSYVSRFFNSSRDLSSQLEIYFFACRDVLIQVDIFNSRRESRCYQRIVFGISCQSQKSQNDLAVSSFVIIYSCLARICFDSIHWWQLNTGISWTVIAVASAKTLSRRKDYGIHDCTCKKIATRNWKISTWLEKCQPLLPIMAFHNNKRQNQNGRQSATRNNVSRPVSTSMNNFWVFV